MGAWNKIEVSDEQSKEILRSYLEERLSFDLVAKRVGLGSSVVLRHLHEKQVIKDRKRQKLDAALRGLGGGMDVSILASWSPVSAWIWGVWFGDGWLSPPIQVGFAGDLSVVERVKLLLHSDAKIYHRPDPKKKDQGWKFNTSSRGFAELVFSKFGLEPGRKSRIIEWPTSLPELYERHFLRGLWDADGCWSHTIAGYKEHKKRYLQGTYASMSVKMVQAVNACLVKHLDVRPKPMRRQTKDGCWVISYSTKEGQKVGNWIYDSDPLDRSERKYQKWLEFANMQVR